MPAPAEPGVEVAPRARARVSALQHQDAGALTEHEAVAALVERAGGALGLVVAGGHRAHRGEAGHGQRVDAGLGAADDDDVGAVERSRSRPQRIASAPDAQALTGACTPPLAPTCEADGAAGPLGMSIGMVQRETRSGPFSSRTSSWSSRRECAADAGAEDDGDPQRVDAAGVPAPASRPGLLGGDHGDLLAAVQPPGPHPVRSVGRVDGQPGDELGREVLDPVVGDRG